MHSAIQTRREGKRGCGYRKTGGIYLVAPREGFACGKLPLVCEICPTCGAGIKPARGWTWVNVEGLFGDRVCSHGGAAHMLCESRCPLAHPETMGRAGLIWIGHGHYPTIADYTSESTLLGISRRLSGVPKEFKLGETWVLLAHRRAFVQCWSEGVVRRREYIGQTLKEGDRFLPAIFTVFKPTAIEVVVTGEEDDEEIEALVKRGITPVKIERIGKMQEDLHACST